MKKRTPTEAVNELCLAFEDAEASRGHGLPDYRVNGKVFANYAVNHHGDGRVALWLNSPAGIQEESLAIDDESYFLPPYVGARGWLGVNLDKDLTWDEIQFQVTQAYLHTSKSDAAIEDVIPDVAAPNQPVDPIEFDPFNDPTCRRKLEEIRSYCFSLPEVIEVPQFGTPSFKAGKKTFVTAYVRNGLTHTEFWVGVDQQSVLTNDERFTVPRYTGHNGWIQFAMRGTDHFEIFKELGLTSYKHFALKRMLNALEEIEA